MEVSKLHTKIMTMNKDILFKVGDPKVAYYQRFVIFTGCLLLVISIAAALLSGNKYYAVFPLIIIVLFSAIIIAYMKVYSVKYSSNWFYISNLFVEIQINASDFIEIQRVKHLDFLLRIVFKNKSYFLLANSDDFFSNFFKSTKEYTREMTLEIKKIIDN